MKNIFIIGGGASGLVSAYFASNRHTNVTIIEKNKIIGKKILMTGNGRCNFFNDDFSIKHYHSESLEILNKIINKENKEKILSFFDDIGVIPNIKDGLYYPITNQAITIKESLENALNKKKVNIKTECEVLEIKKIDNKYKIICNNEIFVADKVIISTGSKAYPKTGSTGFGYNFSKANNVKLNPIKPALVSLNGYDSFYKSWAGIRCNANLKLYENNKFIKEENGEIQLTNYGISGICVFQLSSLISQNISNNDEIIYINFIPYIKDNVYDYLIKRNKILNSKNIYNLLLGLVNSKLLLVILNIVGISCNENIHNIKKEKIDNLIKYLISFPFKVKSVNDFNSSQVCLGGISLDEINIMTMEAKKYKNLYFTGELLDVDGECGGYNLGFAWLSGMIAGSSAGDISD